jgi:hypothetical protein
MRRGPPSRVELVQGTLDLLMLRTLLPGTSLTAIGRKQFATEQSKWDGFSRTVRLIFNPVEQSAK